MAERCRVGIAAGYGHGFAARINSVRAHLQMMGGRNAVERTS